MGAGEFIGDMVAGIVQMSTFKIEAAAVGSGRTPFIFRIAANQQALGR